MHAWYTKRGLSCTFLFNSYFHRERFPTEQEAIEWTWARSEAEIDAVRFVLSRFFELRDGVYMQDRIEEEVGRWNALGWRPHDPRNPPKRPPIDVWKQTRERIFSRDDYTCTYCGKRGGELECDHIHPVAKGGTHEDSNLVTACKPCSRDKGTKTVSEWRAA
ncbi:HNH endonuclease [Limnobacter olei]|uniref:HNH endonuclease n=1 Tax=Limnobacter olei TaxID=3031298 RepID=UPI0039B77F5A